MSSIEVEDAIFSHPAVAEVAVIGVPDEKRGETIKAVVVLAEGATAAEADIIAHCKQRMAGYKAPTSAEFRDATPVRPPARSRSSSSASRTGQAWTESQMTTGLTPPGAAGIGVVPPLIQ